MAWTDEMVESLRQMWGEGLTANEIAKKLGVSKNSIVGKVHRLCLKARPSPIKKKDAEENEPVVDSAVSVEVEDNNASVLSEPVKTKKRSSEKVVTGMKLMQLDSHTCRWPLGDPRDEDFSFCGKKVRMGQTYCDEHSALAYVKAVKK